MLNWAHHSRLPGVTCSFHFLSFFFLNVNKVLKRNLSVFFYWVKINRCVCPPYHLSWITDRLVDTFIGIKFGKNLLWKKCTLEKYSLGKCILKNKILAIAFRKYLTLTKYLLTPHKRIWQNHFHQQMDLVFLKVTCRFCWITNCLAQCISCYLIVRDISLQMELVNVCETCGEVREGLL